MKMILLHARAFPALLFARRAPAASLGRGGLRACLITLLLLTAFALRAGATDYYFNSNGQRIEKTDGSQFSPQAVAGVSATLIDGLSGTVAGDGAVEFIFPANLNFPATDRIFFRGARPVRISLLFRGTQSSSRGHRRRAVRFPR